MVDTEYCYPKNYFSKKNYDTFICQICSEVSRNPMQCIKCGSIYGKRCFSNFIKNIINECPACQNNSKNVQVLSEELHSFYKDLEIKCSNCNKLVGIENHDNHNCNNNNNNCINFEFCKRKVSPNFHDLNVCSNECKLILQIGKNENNEKNIFDIIGKYLEDKHYS